MRGKPDPLHKIGEEDHRNREGEYIWALKDVNFQVQQGEAVGIIGSNGAGKSTLLKILSRVTAPTTGEVRVKGRIASLLEVGTGFHPELTGRENIYMNGAILGMSKGEITQKLDEIVDFSGVEQFIDTPVKRYSSGMYVRLAFAVAAHLEPEILVIDEVLAVGDIAFQKKCIGKMEEITNKNGRTIFFVSHNMPAIGELCSKAYLLEHGKIINSGETKTVVNNYLNMGNFNTNQSRKNLKEFGIRVKNISNPSSIFKFNEIFVLNSRNKCKNNILFGEPFEIVFRGHAKEECQNVRIGFGIRCRQIGWLFTSHQIYNGLPDTLPQGVSEFRVRLDPNFLAPGYYEVGIAADGTAKIADYINDDAISFQILDAPYSESNQWRSAINTGLVHYPCKWSMSAPANTDGSE